MRSLVAAAAALAACSSGSSRERPGEAARAHDAAAARAPAPDDAPGPALPPHRIVADLPTAIGQLVTDDVRVVAFGELHQRVDRPTDARSALARFTDDVLPAIGARTSDLVLETWLVDPGCGQQAAQATAQVEATMQRPPETKSELATLVERARAAGVQPHVMRLTCDDWTAVAPGVGRRRAAWARRDGSADAGPDDDVDYEALLGVITRELGRIATSAVAHRDRQGADRRLVAVYGGALHNDLYPIEGIADWSFAARVDAAAPGGYLEIDLYVPEYAEADQLTRAEPWFPLLDRAGPGHVVVIERGPRSYVVLLPTAAAVR